MKPVGKVPKQIFYTVYINGVLDSVLLKDLSIPYVATEKSVNLSRQSVIYNNLIHDNLTNMYSVILSYNIIIRMSTTF